MILRLLGSLMCVHLVIGSAFAEDVPEHNPLWKAFGDDVVAYVRAAHDAGLLVSSIVYGIEGTSPLRKICPDMSEMACRLESGELADVGAFMLMCTNNPDWVEWEIAYGKRGIDNGADMILVDTPMGASFVSGGFLKGGFCTSCMDRFTKHMTDTFTADEMLQRFGIKALEVPDLIERLSSRQIVGPANSPRAFRNSEPDDLLFRELIRCQEQGAFETRRTLANELRRYAREKNRAVAICTNGADLGSQNPFDHWVRGLMFADLFLFNERGRVIPAVFPSYLGLAQALVEGSYPFEVVFAGDDHYVKDKLGVSDLAPYRTLFLPSPIDPTDNQKRIVGDFVKAGGTLVCQEPQLLMSPQRRENVPLPWGSCRFPGSPSLRSRGWKPGTSCYSRMPNSSAPMSKSIGRTFWRVPIRSPSVSCST